VARQISQGQVVNMAGAIGYARVSTDEQGRENNSLDVQKGKIVAYCDRNGLEILKMFEGCESARTTNRPVFQQMLAYIRKHRSSISHVIVSDLSRLARNAMDQAQTDALLERLDITLMSIDDPITGGSAVGKLSRGMQGLFNEFFSNSLSERTSDRMQAAVKAGRFPWGAPIGYLNVNKTIQPDPDRAPLVRQAFELVKSGRYVTTDAVLKVVTAMGLTTRRGNPVKPQTFSRMLQNPIYAGWVVSKKVRARGLHEPLIAEEVFNAVQMRLNTKSVPHKKLNEDFPLRGIILCVHCRKPLTAGWARGRNKTYAHYWCWNEECRAIKVRRDDLHAGFVNLLSRMEPTAELLAELPQRIATRYAERQKQIASQATKLNSRLAEQHTLNQRAVMAKIKGELSAEEYEVFKEASDAEKSRINAEISTLNSEQSTMEELLRQAELDAVNLVAAWEKGNVNQRQELAKGFFPEGLVYSTEKGFFEPANTVITEMLIRFIDDYNNFGVPDGI
jgi:site-specific DNA recombinase